MQEYLQYYTVYEDGTVERTKASPDKMAGNAKVGRKLRPERCQNGYYRVTLCHKGKTRRFGLHRLVALVHIPNPLNLPVVNHKDGNPSNNHVSNLEWCDYSQNLQHAYDVLGRDKQFGEARIWSKLKEENIPLIRQYASEGMSHVKIGKMFGVSRSTIRDVVEGLTWTHIK